MRFRGPKVSDYDEWPMQYKTYKYGMLNIDYCNGDHQEVKLEGRLLRPDISLNTTGFQPYVGEFVQDFNTVYYKDVKIISVFLCNSGPVPAKWKLHYVKFNPKKLTGFMTKTILEKEDDEKTDDPSVFQFSVSEVN